MLLPTTCVLHSQKRNNSTLKKIKPYTTSSGVLSFSSGMGVTGVVGGMCNPTSLIRMGPFVISHSFLSWTIERLHHDMLMKAQMVAQMKGTAQPDGC